jgi:hypothetical protein
MLITALLLASLLPPGAAGTTPCARMTAGEQTAADAGMAEHDLAGGKKRNRRSRLPRNRSGLPFEEEDSRAPSPKASASGTIAWVPCLSTDPSFHAHPSNLDAVPGKRYLILHVLLI